MDTPRRIHTRDLKPADADILRAFILAAPRPMTVTLRAGINTFGATKDWWHGAFDEGGAMKAIAWMEGKVVTMYSARSDGDAIRAIASTMQRQAAGRPGRDGHTHHLFGPHDTISDFWDVFRALPRTVVGDRSPQLMSCTAAKDASGNAKVAPATTADLRLLFEFTADLSVEQGNPDPRRSSRPAHEKHCQDLIASGRQLIGTDAGKPSLLVELASLDAESILLNNVYVPRPFRRAAVVTRLLSASAKLALQRAPEVFFFADDPSSAYGQGAIDAGFAAAAPFRHLMLKGS
jgi:hypothetical protein